jgi:hypothetical protein
MAPLLIQIHDGLDELARRILSGELQIVADTTTIPDAEIDTTLDVESLQGLARLCAARSRYAEAARICRWLGAVLPVRADPQ